MLLITDKFAIAIGAALMVGSVFAQSSLSDHTKQSQKDVQERITNWHLSIGDAVEYRSWMHTCDDLWDLGKHDESEDCEFKATDFAQAHGHYVSADDQDADCKALKMFTPAEVAKLKSSNAQLAACPDVKPEMKQTTTGIDNSAYAMNHKPQATLAAPTPAQQAAGHAEACKTFRMQYGNLASAYLNTSAGVMFASKDTCKDVH